MHERSLGLHHRDRVPKILGGALTCRALRSGSGSDALPIPAFLRPFGRESDQELPKRGCAPQLLQRWCHKQIIFAGVDDSLGQILLLVSAFPFAW